MKNEKNTKSHEIIQKNELYSPQLAYSSSTNSTIILFFYVGHLFLK